MHTEEHLESPALRVSGIKANGSFVGGFSGSPPSSCLQVQYSSTRAYGYLLLGTHQAHVRGVANPAIACLQLRCFAPRLALAVCSGAVLGLCQHPICDVYEQFEHDGKLSLAWMFPNVKRLHLRGIPMDDAGDGGEQTELSFFKDIQLMSLQLMVLEDYPYDRLPVLAQKPDWARLDITIHPDIYENDPSLTDSCVPACTADVVTSITLRDLGDTEISMREFSSCSRLEHLTFQLQDDTDDDEIVQLVNLKSLTKSCRTLKFRNFIPCFLDVSESQGWRWRVRSGVGKGRWVKGRLRKRMAGRGKDMWAWAVRVQ